MTYQEANALVDDLSFVYKGKSISKEALIECREIIHKALEKQIPKKPIEKDIGKLKISDTAFCPICDNPVIKDETDNYEQAYCCYCGQALDWSDFKRCLSIT